MTERPPCPACGQKGISVQVDIAQETDIALPINVIMQPLNSQRDWRRRWTEIETEWLQLDRPITTTMSSDGINSAHHRLQSFFMQAYHLKDTLIADPSNGLDKNTVESAINQDPRLRLLADMANLDKHYRLIKPPRSGDAPRIGAASGIQLGAGGGWKLRLQVVHHGQSRDGLDIAKDSIDGWRDRLCVWHLI